MRRAAPSTGTPSRAQRGAGAVCSQPGRAVGPATLRGNQTAPGHGCGARFLPRPRGPCEGGAPSPNLALAGWGAQAQLPISPTPAHSSVPQPGQLGPVPSPVSTAVTQLGAGAGPGARWAAGTDLAGVAAAPPGAPRRQSPWAGGSRGL
uniref:Uncharacterized protein n=1 Tax=Malurus cyaneus samueli TaxID=2593467 RepID=A0A8C5TU64_9PASS